MVKKGVAFGVWQWRHANKKQVRNVNHYLANKNGQALRIKQIGRGFIAFDAVTGAYIERGRTHAELWERVAAV